ncbi:hypothetical protein DPMN_028927 [Dreissena polymorpha]|uniref:Uncharacterized protein n=1 Tax=Dreissena polymorpha TaxID=45954 RepID=A0A9D4LWA2_DREPO|nr:hypothetical protein DPMN_160829 [Dreissena polymorpha]KAH3865883.1 hypothetical protein DPMN_028927 [Dreissena polymorpha]
MRKRTAFLCTDGYAEEDVLEPTPKKTFMDKFLASRSPGKDTNASKPEPAKKVETAKKLTEAKPTVSVSAFFGEASIHRVERKVVPAKKVLLTITGILFESFGLKKLKTKLFVLGVFCLFGHLLFKIKSLV